MPGRKFNGGTYRYGFQGQEQDDEIKGEGNSVNFKYRVHDPRIGRFLSLDPLSRRYPYYSPYAFSGNRVMDAIELEGAEPLLLHHLYMAYLETKYSFKNWGNGMVEGVNNYNEGTQRMKEGRKNNDLGQEIAGFSQKIQGATQIADKTLSAMEVGMEAVGSIPGVDVVTDPILASYYGSKGDYASASAYVGAMALPGVSGVVLKGSGRVLKYALKKTDLDLRGSGVAFRDALEAAFEKSGLSKDKYEVTRWGKDQYGKDVPVEFRGEGGAEVSIDFGHVENGPDAPHIGWQTAGKRNSGGAERGHIILDEVPAARQQSE